MSIFTRMVVLGVGTTLVVSLAVIFIGGWILEHEAKLAVAGIVDSADDARIEFDQRPFDGAARSFRRTAALFSLLAVAVAGLLSAMAAAAVTRSIGDLGDALAGMAQGEREMRHSEEGPKEIARLARQVNRLGELVERYRFEQSTSAARADGKLRGHARYLEQTNRALIDIANRDPLTGLANRRRLELELVRHIDLAQQSENPLAVIMMDLDNFKAYNDSVGHLAGDTLLRTVADALRARTRVTDVVVRWGGDEFCILMPYTTADRAVVAAESLIEAVCEATRSLPDASDAVGASAGVACFPDDAEESSELIAAADAALYRVKETGRGSVLRLPRGEPAGTA